MAELQQLILDTIDAQETIQDTRSLIIPSQIQPATSHEDQIAILGALNSLLSRDVRSDLFYQHVPWLNRPR
jgi:phenylalanyl-tRNA synthetase alpha chain